MNLAWSTLFSDRKKENRADRVITIDRGLNQPNGVALLKGSLYVAEVNRVLRYDDIENRLDNPPSPVVVNDSFPTDKHHGWKFIRFGPDGKLYVPVGAPCNICEREAPALRNHHEDESRRLGVGDVRLRDS